jgi:polyferredoxin
MANTHLPESVSVPEQKPVLDGPAAFNLKGPAYRSRRRRIEWSRAAVQLFTLAVVIWIGVEFWLWANSVITGQPVVARPQGVEGFLPISALISLRYWWLTGTISQIHPAGLVLLVLILSSALMLKKSFCSWLCPIGTVSESLTVVGRRIFRRRIKLPRWLDYPLRSIKYLLLSFFVWAVFVQMTPRSIELFLGSPYNRVADIKMLMFFSHISPFSVKLLMGLLALSVVVPFFWCRYLCPYGALLGFLSMLSPLKVTRKPSSCIDCQLCAKACPSHIAVDKVNRVHSDECFGCLSCIAACPVPDALNVETPKFWRRRISPLVYAVLVFVLFFGGIGLARITGHWQNNISDAEYQSRMGEINSPKYHHAQGQVPAYGPED